MSFGAQPPPWMQRGGPGPVSQPPNLPPPGPRESTTQYTNAGATSTIPGYPQASTPKMTGNRTRQMIDALMRMPSSQRQAPQMAATPQRLTGNEHAGRGAAGVAADDGMEEEWRRPDGAVVAPGTMGATAYRVPKGQNRWAAMVGAGGGGGGGGNRSQPIGEDLAAFEAGNKSPQRLLYEKQLAAGQDTGNTSETARFAAALETSNKEYAQRNAPAPPVKQT